MGRLRITKRFSFAFLGEAWKDGYLEFESFTANDISDNIATTVDPNNPDPKAVKTSYDNMLARLEEHFVSGKFPTEDGKLDDIKKGELGSLPVEIIQGAINFLSTSPSPSLPTPSAQS